MIILKLGGSLITNKTKKFSLRRTVIDRVAEEIKGSGEKALIIVHGGGAFGHPIAAKYGLKDGLSNERQLRGMALTRKAMVRLNIEVMDALLKHGLNVVSIQPSASTICTNKRINEINIKVIERLLDLETIPVLYGDVVLDTAQGLCILSGDQIVSYLSKVFKPKRVILATDVDGIFDKDPKKFKDASFIPEINQENVNEILESFRLSEGDVTEGIKGKIQELMDLAKSGVESIIINALEPGRLKKALSGSEVKGTRVKV